MILRARMRSWRSPVYFPQGTANQLTELVFNVADPALKGQRFRVGNGEYLLE
jgi:hypothetical protein